MRDRRVALAALALGTGLLLTASLARGQETVSQPKKVFGYLDPKTGKFVPASTAPRPDTSSTPATTGTVTLKVSIKLASTELEKSSINCNLSLTAESETVTGTAVSVGTWLETATYSATISGSTATCTVSIPYAWVLPAASASTTNTFAAEFSVVATGGTTTAPIVFRETDQTLFTAEKVPPTGTMSSYTASVTL